MVKTKEEREKLREIFENRRYSDEYVGSVLRAAKPSLLDQIDELEAKVGGFRDLYKRTKPIVDLWNRVCDEVDDGKSWDEIDNGTRKNVKLSADAWEAYMSRRMMHQLFEFIWRCDAAKIREGS